MYTTVNDHEVHGESDNDVVNPIGSRSHGSTKTFRKHYPSVLCGFISAVGGCNNNA